MLSYVGLQIFFHILFSNVLSLLSVLLVVVHVSYPYVNEGYIIIAMYNFVFVFFENKFDFRNLV
jgi:hypothetical protein